MEPGTLDPSVFDPQGFDLGIVLTAAGIPVAAGILFAFLQILKRVPFLGVWLMVGENARLANIVLSAVLIGYAAFAIGVVLTPVSAFLLFLAWVNLAGFTEKAYESAPTNLKTSLGGPASTS